MSKWTFLYDNRATAILDVLKDGKAVFDFETLRILNAHDGLMEALRDIGDLAMGMLLRVGKHDDDCVVLTRGDAYGCECAYGHARAELPKAVEAAIAAVKGGAS